jgi:D-3-phosphoglycerate dehydrogenase
LARAAREGWIAGAALDVLTAEPAAPGHPLIGLDNVIVTPHAAFYSEASIAELSRKATANVVAVLTGGLPPAPYFANPEVLDRPNCRAAKGAG